MPLVSAMMLCPVSRFLGEVSQISQDVLSAGIERKEGRKTFLFPFIFFDASGTITCPGVTRLDVSADTFHTVTLISLIATASTATFSMLSHFFLLVAFSKSESIFSTLGTDFFTSFSCFSAVGAVSANCLAVSRWSFGPVTFFTTSPRQDLPSTLWALCY